METIMTKAEFLYELRKRLKKLPAAEIEAAMSYYEEYFAEAGAQSIQDEQELIARMGTPAQVASTIIGEYATKVMYEHNIEKKNSSLKTMWIVILAVFASPIAIPLALTAVVLVFAFLLCIFSVYLSFFAAAVALIVGGLTCFFLGIIALFAEPIYGIVMLGYALVCLSLGLALFLGMVKLTHLTIRGITYMFASLLKRNGKNNASDFGSGISNGSGLSNGLGNEFGANGSSVRMEEK
ncbi:MAG: DUF1700 domain-containing protein [Coriobacteriales bacterium]|nr:DUF1700 domain-containing protein [Coriobacteriales bacterium]